MVLDPKRGFGPTRLQQMESRLEVLKIQTGVKKKAPAVTKPGVPTGRESPEWIAHAKVVDSPRPSPRETMGREPLSPGRDMMHGAQTRMQQDGPSPSAWRSELRHPFDQTMGAAAPAGEKVKWPLMNTGVLFQSPKHTFG